MALPARDQVLRHGSLWGPWGDLASVTAVGIILEVKDEAWVSTAGAGAESELSEPDVEGLFFVSDILSTVKLWQSVL